MSNEWTYGPLTFGALKRATAALTEEQLGHIADAMKAMYSAYDSAGEDKSAIMSALMEQMEGVVTVCLQAPMVIQPICEGLIRINGKPAPAGYLDDATVVDMTGILEEAVRRGYFGQVVSAAKNLFGAGRRKSRQTTAG